MNANPKGQNAMSDKLAGRLRALREAAGLSQKELAGLLDVDQSTISKWELGQREPGFEDLTKLWAIIRPRIPADKAAGSDVRAAKESFDIIIGGRDDDKIVLIQAEPKARPGRPSPLRVPLFAIKRAGFEAPKLEREASGNLDAAAALTNRASYAVVCQDDAMTPAIDAGDTAILDANRPIRDGDMTFVQLESGECFFAQFKGTSLSDPADPTSVRAVALRFLNPVQDFTIQADRITRADGVAAILKP